MIAVWAAELPREDRIALQDAGERLLNAVAARDGPPGGPAAVDETQIACMDKEVEP